MVYNDKRTMWGSAKYKILVNCYCSFIPGPSFAALPGVDLFYLLMILVWLMITALGRTESPAHLNKSLSLFKAIFIFVANNTGKRVHCWGFTCISENETKMRFVLRPLHVLLLVKILLHVEQFIFKLLLIVSMNNEYVGALNCGWG